jgi:CheY-like chemotaxis protein
MDLVIVDEQLDDMSGIEFVQRLVQINPLVNTAIVGTRLES